MIVHHHADDAAAHAQEVCDICLSHEARIDYLESVIAERDERIGELVRRLDEHEASHREPDPEPEPEPEVEEV